MQPLRRALSGLGEREQLSLARLYQKLEALEGGRFSLRKQAERHAGVCGGAADIHKSWGFLPWHRACVLEHERILAKISRRGEFRLPYWDWDSVSAPPFPALRSAETVDGQPNPFYRMPLPSPSLFQQAVSKDQLSAMLAPFAFVSDSGTGFGGGRASPGVAYTALPHQGVHRLASRDMEDPQTAGLDPLFYLHHANMDRMWWIWEKELRHGAVSYPEDWRRCTDHLEVFTQPLVNGSLNYGALLDIAQLGYGYADLKPPVVVDGQEISMDLHLNRDNIAVGDTAKLRSSLDPPLAILKKRAFRRQSADPREPLPFLLLTVHQMKLIHRANGRATFTLWLRGAGNSRVLRLGHVPAFVTTHESELTVSHTFRVDLDQWARFVAENPRFQVLYREGMDGPLAGGQLALPVGFHASV